MGTDEGGGLAESGQVRGRRPGGELDLTSSGVFCLFCTGIVSISHHARVYSADGLCLFRKSFPTAAGRNRRDLPSVRRARITVASTEVLVVMAPRYSEPDSSSSSFSSSMRSSSARTSSSVASTPQYFFSSLLTPWASFFASCALNSALSAL